MLAAQYPALARPAVLSDRRRGDAEQAPSAIRKCSCQIEPRRDRQHRRGACRNGHRRGAHDPADDRCRRARRRLGEGPHPRSRRATRVKYGNQDTDGSRSVRHFIQPMRLCGASARLMLEQAAAKRWGVPVAEVDRAAPRDRAQALGPQARLRRCRGRCRGAAGAGAGRGEAEGAERVPLHRQGQRAAGRLDGHHDRQGDVRPGRRCSTA